MLVSISEGVLLEKAVATGLISAVDVAAAREAQTTLTVPRKWGLLLDRLISQGKLTDEQVRRLHDDLALGKPGSPALDRTMDGGLDRTMDGGPRRSIDASASSAREQALDQTMASQAGSPQPMSAPQIPSPSFPAPHWDKYEFLALLGRGGMGSVYRARDRRLGRLVALKFIHGDDPGLIQRFLQEARSQARLDHPFICKVFEVGSVDNKPYIAMELVDGRTLDRMSPQLSLAAKLQVLKDTAEALHHAHEHGIIHRDIKPSNIMIEQRTDGGFRPVLMDFGLARESGDSHGLTESGAVMGTPAYMSPEQARGEARRLDRRSDVYSLGATLYEVLVGRPPFEDQTVINILLKVMNDPPTPLRSLDPQIPEAVELVVSKCLNKEPEQRYQTAKALAEDLGRYLSTERVQAKRLSYTYRLTYWARQNRTLAALAAILCVTVISALGIGIRARIIAVQKERRAKEQAELSRRIGQSVQDLEWVARTAYLLPLHDTSYEQKLVRDRMTEIQQELQGHSDIGPRLEAYARGRGLLALHDFGGAQTELARAERLGHVDLELDYALGRALGELYSQALDDARKSGDKSFFEKRKAELDAELLRPALRYLQRSRALRSVSSLYVEGLIAYFQQDFDLALTRAEQAQKLAPWLYEAVKLGGDVLLERARAERDRGEHDRAAQHFAESVARYKQAAEIGRSDHSVHEALAEAYIRWEELDFYRGKNPEPYLQEALRAADKALVAAPKASHGHTKKAFAYYFYGEYSKQHLSPQQTRMLRKNQIEEGISATIQHHDDPYAHEITGLGFCRAAEIDSENSKSHIKNAVFYLDKSVKINQRFPWAYNDYAIALLAESKLQQQSNQSPIDTIQRAVALAEQALTIDPGYIYAMNTIALSSLRASTWLIEHGQDPSVWIQKGIQAAQQALKLNQNYSFAYGNQGTILLNQLYYELLSGQYTTQTGFQAVDSFSKMSKIIGNSTQIDTLLGTIYQIESQKSIENKSNPSGSIETGLNSIKNCINPPNQDPYCIDIQSRIISIQAQWLSKSKKPSITLIEQAYRLSQQAMASMPDDEVDSMIASASIALQFLQSTPSTHPLRSSSITHGLSMTDKVLASSPALPRGLVLKGALLRVRAQGERGIQRQSTLRMARDALKEGLAGNPLLRRQYGATLAELEQQLAP